MKLEGWEEVEQETWVNLPLEIRATITYNNPYKVVFIAESKGLKKLKQEENEPANAEDRKDQSEGRADSDTDQDLQRKD